MMEELASLVGVLVGAAAALYLVSRFNRDTWLGGKLIITALMLGGYTIPRLFF